MGVVQARSFVGIPERGPLYDAPRSSPLSSVPDAPNDNTPQRNSSAISWQSRKQDLVATSTTDQLPPTQIYTDSQGALAHITTGISKARTKHIDVCYHNSRELHQRKVVKYDYVNTNDNPADILTKALPREKHEKFARAMDWEGKDIMALGFLFICNGLANSYDPLRCVWSTQASNHRRTVTISYTSMTTPDGPISLRYQTLKRGHARQLSKCTESALKHEDSELNALDATTDAESMITSSSEVFWQQVESPTNHAHHTHTTKTD